MIIPKYIYEAAIAHVKREPSRESCGLILSDREGKLTRLIICNNLQDERHQEDPLLYPRDSKTAYFIDPKQLLEIQKEMRETDEKIAIIYHSHINAEAYFSEEDYRQAVFKEEVLYPNAKYLIFSVIEGEVAESALYSWNHENRQFEQELNRVF